MLTVDARNGDSCSFLVLLRHMVWMHGLQCSPPAHAPTHPAWVFDGVQVCAAKRHAYVSGRSHAQTPGWSDTRVRRGSAFRGRLLVPHPRHRAALRRLMRRPQVPSCDDIVSLHAWLHNEADDGGWRLRPYIPLVWVCPPCSFLLQLVLPSRRTDTDARAQDTPDWEPDGDSAPATGTPVAIHPAALTGHKLALEHWASVTPEVQVMPLHVARRAKGWLRHEGLVPHDDLLSLSEQSPHLSQLMQSDAVSQCPKAGRFWQLSDPLQELLTRMVKIVEHTVACREEDAPPVADSREAVMSAYTVPPASARRAATPFEWFLWVSRAQLPLCLITCVTCGCARRLCVQLHADSVRGAPPLSMLNSGRAGP
jgi:hypothetical protein